MTMCRWVPCISGSDTFWFLTTYWMWASTLGFILGGELNVASFVRSKLYMTRWVWSNIRWVNIYEHYSMLCITYFLHLDKSWRQHEHQNNWNFNVKLIEGNVMSGSSLDKIWKHVQDGHIIFLIWAPNEFTISFQRYDDSRMASWDHELGLSYGPKTCTLRSNINIDNSI